MEPTVRNDVETVGTQARPDVGEVETSGEVVAVGEDEARPQVGIVLQFGVGDGQLLEHREVGSVALVRAVQPDQQHRAFAFEGDSGRCLDRISHVPRLRRSTPAMGCSESSKLVGTRP